MSTPNTHFGPVVLDGWMAKAKKIHFVGIGGINLSSLARLCLRRGYTVSGTDRAKTELTEAMEAEGIVIHYTHRAEYAEDCDLLVYTVAISEDNPEYQYAKAQGIPCVSRADFLGYLMTAYPRRVGVSGMHGKSSCTSMIAHTMLRGGVDPTVLSGAELREMGGSYCLGQGEDFVFEACEYMDSFLDFSPTVAVILNIEMDHVDYFHSLEQIRTSFAAYAARTGKDGFAVCNADDPEVMAALRDYEGTPITFGIRADHADYVARSVKSCRGAYSFEIFRRGEFFCRVQLSVLGEHHVYNALACAAACDLCGMKPEAIAEGLSDFGGAARRMEYKGSLNGAAVYDDYGHHPTEIATTLSGAKEAARGGGRLICVYQPHTYSRTHALFDDFAAAFGEADRVILMDIYAAREENRWGIRSEALVNAIGANAVYGGSPAESAARLCETAEPGDLVVLMGAGDIWRIYEYLKFDEAKEERRA